MARKHINFGGPWPVGMGGAVRVSVAAWLVLCLAAPLPAIAATLPRAEQAQRDFARAEAMRQELEGSPQAGRTRLDYLHVLDAYRTVYHGDPASAKSPFAITAVAELLAEEGRLFGERKPLQDAVGQYEFLYKQYPRSALRVKGVLVEAEILDKDLNEREAARARLRSLLQSDPQSPFLAEARRELAEMQPQAGTQPALRMADAAETEKPAATVASMRSAGHDSAPVEDSEAGPETPLPPPAPEAEAHAVYASGKEPPAAVLTAFSEKQTPTAHGGRVMVTDIRHWSTPNYTRVAIDLGGEVRFQAGRVPNPDRIYFDLYNTRLAPQLMGHLINVQGDAFLKDIRAAQYTTEITRVVLDVSSIAEYSAFLLPNPYRLIIDVHGRKGAASSAAKATAPTEGPGVSTEVGPGGSATTTPATETRPAKTAAAEPPAATVAARQPKSTAKATVSKAAPSKAAPLPETVLAPVDEPKPAKKPATSNAQKDAQKDGLKDGQPEAGAAPAQTTDQPANPATTPNINTANPNLDENGHETGVAHPPSDVSVTPSDDSQPQAAPPSAPAPAATPAPESTPAAPEAAPAGGTPAGATSDQQNLVMNKPVAKPAPKSTRRHKPSPGQPALAQSAGSANDLATLPQQPQAVADTTHPTTHPVVAEVAPAKDDATDTKPFAASSVPTAAGPGASSGLESASAPDSAAGNSLTAKPTRRKRGKHTQPETPASPDPEVMQVHEADPTATGERSLIRALGLKIGRIVIDPGHGGHDSGTIGPDGLEEKDVVLDVGLRLGKLLRQRLGAEVTFTRTTDTFIPLETRTAIANKAEADLFVSIHANSSKDTSARGVETYYLNFTSSPDALNVAARENAVSEKSIHELQDLVKKITLKDKIDESREFAGDVEHGLTQGLGNSGAARDRGVKKAPFVVLIGANMPSILTEISFVSNPDDARDLRNPAYRERIAESLYAGIARYINSLSSVRLAENTTHPAGN